jgi:hypothetical protein
LNRSEGWNLRAWFIVLIGVVLIGTSLFFGMNYYGTRFDKESKVFVDEKVPLIMKNWNYVLLYELTTPNFKNVTPREEMRKLFLLSDQKLGKMEVYKGSKGQADIFIDFPKGILVRATYIAELVFEKDNGKIELGLIRDGSEWEIESFRLTSNAFSNP